MRKHDKNVKISKQLLDQKSQEFQIRYAEFENERAEFEMVKQSILAEHESEIEVLNDHIHQLKQENYRIESQKNMIKTKYEQQKRINQQHQTPSDQFRGLASTNTKSKQTLDALQTNNEFTSRNENASPVEYLDSKANGGGNTSDRDYEEPDEANIQDMQQYSQNMMLNNYDAKQSMVRLDPKQNFNDPGYYSDEGTDMENAPNADYNPNRVKEMSLGQKQFMMQDKQQQPQDQVNKQASNFGTQNPVPNMYYDMNQRTQVPYLNMQQNSAMMGGTPQNMMHDPNIDSQMMYNSYHQNRYIHANYGEASYIQDQNMQNNLVSGNSTDRYNRPRNQNQKMPQNYMGKCCSIL